MNMVILREKLINNSKIRNYFLDKSYKNKTYSQLFKKNVKGRGRLGVMDWISLFLSGTAMFTLSNPFNLSFISNNSESLLFSLFVLSSIMTTLLMKYCVEGLESDDSDDSDDSFKELGFSMLGLFGVSLLGLSYKQESLIIFGVFLSCMPLFRCAFQWIFAALKSAVVKEKDYEKNLQEEDHQELVEHLSRDEMILFLKNYKQYVDLPFEKMEKQRIEEMQKMKKECEIMHKEEKVENYANMLYEKKMSQKID